MNTREWNTPTEYLGGEGEAHRLTHGMTYRQALSAAKSSDPVEVVRGIRRAAHAVWLSRDIVLHAGLTNPACPASVREFARQYWTVTQ